MSNVVPSLFEFKKPFFLVFVLFTLNSLAQAQSPAGSILTLQQAIDTGLKSNASINQLREKLNETSGSISLGRSTLFPTINLNADVQKKKDATANKTSVPFGGDPYDNYGLDVSLSQPLFYYGVVDGVRKLELDDQIAKTDLKIGERDLTSNIIQAYYRAVFSQKQWQLLIDEQNIVTESLQTTKHRMQIGRGQLLDVLQVQTQLALLKPKIEDAKNQLTVSYSQLAAYMGVEKLPSETLSTNLPSVKTEEVKSLIESQSVELPELTVIKLSRDQNHLERNVAWGKDLPQLKFDVDYSFASYSSSQLLEEPSNSWVAQLVLTVPLFSGLSSRDESKIYSARDSEYEHQFRDKSDSLKVAETSALQALDSSDVSLSSSEEAVDLANKSFNEASRNYRLSTIDFVQYLQVQQTRLDALISLQQIKLNSINAATNYVVSKGGELNRLAQYLSAKKDTL
ncbi:MAG: TolC family protein [Pseudobdellovibrio sp.]